MEDVNFESFREDHEFLEGVLLDRSAPYIDFGLARYGLNHNVAQKLHIRGDEGLRSLLAIAPHSYRTRCIPRE